MKTRLTLRPGQNGTKKLAQKYGDRLVAVRYHYDVTRRRRFKTVEIVEEELPWSPPLSVAKGNELVLLRVGYDEAALRQSVKAAGGSWLPERKLWRLPARLAHALGLAERIEK